MNLRRLATVLALTVLAASCRRDTGGLPKKWAPVKLGKHNECPAVAGKYFDSSAPLSWMLANRLVPWDTTKYELAWFELTGSADTALTVTIATYGGPVRTGRLKRGTETSGDYFCTDGWLQIGDRVIPSTWDSDMVAPNFQPGQRAMHIAPGNNGALVARLDFTAYEEFTVWCGDGCKGFPLPWTFRTRSRWTAALPWNPDGFLPGTSDSDPEFERVTNVTRRRIEAQEKAMETGVDAPEPAGNAVRGRSAERR